MPGTEPTHRSRHRRRGDGRCRRPGGRGAGMRERRERTPILGPIHAKMDLQPTETGSGCANTPPPTPEGSVPMPDKRSAQSASPSIPTPTIESFDQDLYDKTMAASPYAWGDEHPFDDDYLDH